jgi:hypothetical protein
MKIQQVKEGSVIYEDEIKEYNYSIPQLIKNGALKITIEYPTSTIIITTIKESEAK